MVYDLGTILIGWTIAFIFFALGSVVMTNVLEDSEGNSKLILVVSCFGIGTVMAGLSAVWSLCYVVDICWKG